MAAGEKAAGRVPKAREKAAAVEVETAVREAGEVRGRVAAEGAARSFSHQASAVDTTSSRAAKRSTSPIRWASSGESIRPC